MPEEPIPDLWPANIAVDAVRTPLSILRAQAAALGRHTKNVLEAEVTTSKDVSGDLRHTFTIVAPALDDYRYRLFTIAHDIKLYPIRVVEPFSLVPPKLDNEQEFMNWLKVKLASRETQDAIAALVAQSSESALSA